MVPVESVLTFAAVAFLIVIVPGPSVLFVISRALMFGRRAALLTVLGNAAGAFLQVVAVAIGIGALIERSALAFTVIKLLGAAYLVYLGVQAIRHRRSLAEAAAVSTPRRDRRVLAEGFVVGITNPKTIIFFTAVLPQFVEPAAGGVPGQLLVLGALFGALALILDSAWALAASTGRAWLARSPQRISRIGGASGAITIGLGVSLAFSGRSD